MSIRQKILKAIQRDSKNLNEICAESGIDRKIVQDNMSSMVSEGLITRQKDGDVIVYHITDKGTGRIGNPNGKEIVQKFGQKIAHPQGQPEVPKNTGSAERHGSPPDSADGSAQSPIEYTAASAKTVQELANALDRINALKQDVRALTTQIEAQNILINSLRKDHGSANTLTFSTAILELQSHLSESVAIQIGEDYIHVFDSDDRAYESSAKDCIDVVISCINLEKRLVA